MTNDERKELELTKIVGDWAALTIGPQGEDTDAYKLAYARIEALPIIYPERYGPCQRREVR